VCGYADLVKEDFGAASGWVPSYKRWVADVNGDGYSDIVGAGSSGSYISLGTASGEFTVAKQFGSGHSPNPLYGTTEMGDVNGDGRADLVGFSFESVNVVLGQADGTFAGGDLGTRQFTYKFGGWIKQDDSPRLLGDFNGDGKADIIGFDGYGTWVALNTAQGTSTTFASMALGLNDFGQGQGWSSFNLFHRAIGDVNGDGRDDIIGFGYAGTLVSLSKGDGTFTPATLALDDFGFQQGWTSQDFLPRVVGDVDGDGRADIVGFGYAGVYVALGQVDGTFADAVLEVEDFTPNQGWTSNTAFPRTLADINNDGRIDIVGFGYAGVLAGLNTGSDYLF
jgi:hypothetical protein